MDLDDNTACQDTAERRLFISFSSRDEIVGDFVRLLWLRFGEQSFSVFKYETYEEQIPSGVNIGGVCKAEIERADYCLVVISDASFESDYTKMEVAHAFSLRRENFVFPLVLTDKPASKWPAPYDAFREIKALIWEDKIGSLKVAAREDLIDHAIRGFCADQHLQYFPPKTDPPRLPLRRRLYQELWGVKSIDHSRKAQTIESLLENCSVFLDYYNNNDYEVAAEELGNLIRAINRKFPEVEIYYPKIVKAVVNTQCSNSEPAILKDIRDELLTLNKSGNKWIDANLFAMLGDLDIKLGDFTSALKHFEESESYLSCHDPALIHNMILAAILGGNLAKLEKSMAKLEGLLLHGTVVSQPGDLFRLHLVRMLYMCLKGQSDIAIIELNEVERIDEDAFDLVRQMLDIATDQARRSSNSFLIDQIMRLLGSLEEITKRHSRITWISIAQRRAYTAMEIGNYNEAISVICRVLAHPEFAKSIQPLLDAVLIYHAAGKNDEAKNFLTKALSTTKRDLKKQSPPMSEADFFYARGLANWLAGRDESAKSDYRDAGDVQPWYEIVYNWIDRNVLKIHFH